MKSINIELREGKNLIELRNENNRLIGEIHLTFEKQPMRGFTKYHYDVIGIQVKDGQGAKFDLPRVETIVRAE